MDRQAALVAQELQEVLGRLDEQDALDQLVFEDHLVTQGVLEELDHLDVLVLQVNF